MRVTRAKAAAAHVKVDEQADPIEIEKEIMNELALHGEEPVEETVSASDEAASDSAIEESLPKSGDLEQVVNKDKRKQNGTRKTSGRKAKLAEPEASDDADVEESETPAETTEELEIPLVEHKPKKAKRQTKRAAEALGDSIHTDETATSLEPTQVMDISQDGDTSAILEQPEVRSQSPEVEPSRVLLPKSPAKQLLAKEKSTMRSTSNKENFSPVTMVPAVVLPPLHQVMDEADPLGLPEMAEEPVTEPLSEVTPTTQDPLAAMDALEEAIQQIDESLPQVNEITSPQKALKVSPFKLIEPVSKPANRTSLGRTSSVRKSVVPNPSTARATDPKRTTSVKKPLNRQSTIKITSTTIKPTQASDTTTSKPAPVIPHSKPRPISLSFPTPPRQVKSKPAPLPTFQLPGEAIAAKLKAAKEARQKKSEEPEVKKPAFKARPAPRVKDLSAVPVVRQTTASRARESMMGMSQSVNGVRPNFSASTTGVGPRPSMAASTSVSIARSRASLAPTPKARPTSVFIAPARASRESSVKPRVVSNPSAAKGTAKGREVFGRFEKDKAETERVKKEKEDAARKAREEAAERGRKASREWAEKQKVRALKTKMEAKEREGVAA